ncbi:clustered mitochondria protein homolog isoform X1 [Spodoptera frugiperda]|uniref:Clustered mitochondria protein homolog n=1 Tax=Spodoptera frugiperda TaxID=7108 RepID=A0A9R0D4P0_SPOFR|nr:clustered mitochondria protein homolog isoform X1 [Spodoptera frugiperda]XP_050556971.1 clustered mitochondria protein homolog isoform X1 [Spodoptera frugiperda]
MALGSDVHDNSTKNASQKVKKCPANNSVNDKTSSGNANNAEKQDKQSAKMKNDKKDVCVKPVVCSNGHASTPNGRAEDEGDGGSVPAPRVSYAAAARKPPSPQINNTLASFPPSTDSQKVKANGEKLSQPKSGVCTMKVNGEGLIPNSNDSKSDKISTKEPIVNGTDKNDTIVNGDPKKELDCDISSSDNTKVVSNGINSDSNDTKTNKSEEKVEVIKQVCPIKPEGKQISENKKEKKTKTADKTNDTEKKKDSAKDKNADGKKEKKDDGTVHKGDAGDKVNGECSKTLNGEGDRESSPSEDGDEKKRDAEVVFIQDMGFTVKIVSPGAEPLDIQVSSMELVQEIHQVLMDREDSCHRTCFSLQLDGVTLDNFAELKNIEGLKEGSVIKVVEEPYTMREARIHVRHVRDLLKSIDYTDAYAGQECSSLAFLNIITQGDILEKKKSRPESVDCTPPDYIMPGSTERPLLPLHPGLTKENKAPQCLKVLTTSGWNPPPGPRKMCGDLLYLHVVTLEDRHFHITACPRGFYLNQSTEEVFNPRPATPSLLCHSLIELLSIVSPAFKRNFALVQKKRMQKHPFERVATPYQVYQWASPMLDHTVDAIRAEDTFSSKLGYEEHIPGQTRDWNEELQTTRELPRSTLPERLLRERAIFKVHSDFVAAATRGAMAVVDGNVMAINPGEEPKMQMFIWNNIFFSLGFDVRDHYKDLGGDAAAFVAPRNDLQGVRVYSAVDTAGLHTLGTVVVDYRGYRVTAQSIIPGILEKEQEQSVVYGSIDFGTTVLSHPKYMELLSKAGQQLKIMPHSVISANGETVELCSSVECKGIIGNDGRHYILDLLRTFPPDVNFLQLEDDELREDIKSMGFPIIHKHKLCCLRQELVDSFVEARYFMFIRYAAFHLQQLSAKRQRDTAQKSIENKDIDMKEAANETEKKEEKTKRETKSQEKEVKEKKHKKEDKKEKESAKKEAAKEKTAEEEKPAAKSEKKEDDLLLNENYSEIDTDVAKKIVESITDSICSGGDKQESDSGERSRAVVAAAARAVASLKESEFDVRFNPDVYSAGIKHAAEPEQLAKQRHLVKEAAAFLLTTQIPAFVRECLEHTSAPMDGAGLTEALHGRGINVRYLGRVANALRPHAQLSYLHAIAVAELLLRAAKHIYTAYLQGCEAMCIGAAVAHFLNCLLGACGSPALSAAEGPGAARPTRGPRGRRARRHAHAAPPPDPHPDWQNLTPKSLFSQIKQELKAYWGYELNADSMDSVIEKHGLQKISLLRSFALKVGLQLMLREYDFDSKNKAPFTANDIMNIFPVVKHINPRASDAYNFYTTGQNKIQAGAVSEGHELIAEALNLLNNVYGAMHGEIAQCLRMVARLCYVTGEHRDAMAYQQKAVLMSERVNGIDHPYTITEYSHLALYCFANGQVSTALKLLYRARYLALLVCGENHPEMALLDSNIALILHAVGEYELSLRFAERALAVTCASHGARSLKAAVARHLLARTLSCLGDFRAALQHEKETYSIYKQQLGEKHEKTRESSECLRHLTQQAVVLQKRLAEAYARAPHAAPAPPPLHIQPPGMASVIDMLNLINGILFVQISPQDIEQFKAEIEKRQLKELPIPGVLGELGSEEKEQKMETDAADS